MTALRQFLGLLWHSFRNLLPIVLVVGLFQGLLIREVPEDWVSIATGMAVLVFGVAVFLQGLELGIFPIGKNLSNEFARKGKLLPLLLFGFCLGFAAVIAEPALTAVATKAELISAGRIDALTLRVIVAVSVGLVVALGMMRTLLGHSLLWYLLPGYLIAVGVSYVAPPQIIGLAYDAGGVTTNIVTVPLIAAMGLGLAASLRGRNPLIQGFGLVALAVMVPRLTVQLYGLLVYALDDGATPVLAKSPHLVLPAGLDEPVHDLAELVYGMLGELVHMMLDVLPIIAVVLLFQYLVIRRPLAHLPKVMGGFMLVIVGLYAFVLGLKLGLFPIGQQMAEQLIQLDSPLYLHLFAFAIGFAATIAEPALIAIGEKAEEAGRGRLKGNRIRLLVALGVAIGIMIGVHRILTGESLLLYIMVSYALVILLTWAAPKYIVPLAFDLGGVTTSEVTVPLITALGIGLATYIEGRDVLIDGFGLIAFASLFPVVTVLLYAIVVELFTRTSGGEA